MKTPFVPRGTLLLDRAVRQRAASLDETVEAFSVACGIGEIEALVESEGGWTKDIPRWYALWSALLGMPCASEVMQARRTGVKCGIISELRTQHAVIENAGIRIERIRASVGTPTLENGALSIVTDEALARLRSYDDRQAVEQAHARIAELIATGRSIGLNADLGLLEVDGFRCQPAVVLEDFAKLYGID